MSYLLESRTGLALGAWENAARYVWNDREQFGTKIGNFQGMQHQLAQAWTEIQAARALVYNAARLKEAGKDFVRDAAMAKLYSSQVAGRVSGQAIEWMGGMGFVREGIGTYSMFCLAEVSGANVVSSGEDVPG
jgi:short-chain 2-methylacyl-CoA dehydrogenase